jgi:nickel-dependent lactate racemase
MAVLRYGVDSSVTLQLANGVPPEECGTPHGEPVANLPAAIAEALTQPLEYPPLARSTTPGDRVVLALDHSLPQAAQITAVVIEALLDAGVGADGISVLQATANGDASDDDPCRLLSSSVREKVTLVRHDPTDRQAFAYLAADDAGEPIVVHRAIQDADLVLPIGCLHRDTAAGYFGIHSAVFPAFSDKRTLERFRNPDTLGHGGQQRRQLAHEADHVAWLLGINFTLQLVPGGGDQFLHVLAGQSEAVRHRGREWYRAAWREPLARRASLVVAAIEGGTSQQTWENLGRALSAALPLVEAEGHVAVCCDLAASPGPAIQQIVGARSLTAALRRIGKEPPPDALPAAQLIRALRQTRVYLLSRLDPAVVESLDIVPIAHDEELARLTKQHQSCIWLSNAPHAIVKVEEE